MSVFIALSRVRIPRLWGTLTFLAAWLLPVLPAFSVRARTNASFFVHRRDAIGRHIAKYGMHEPLVTRWIAEYLDGRTDALVVDVGANLGWHAVHAALHHQVATVVAFEPDPFNAWLLERNKMANGVDNLILDSRCVGAAPGVAKLYRYKSSNGGRHSVAVDHGFGVSLVPMTDLDSALDSLGMADRSIALVKIDVEGYEPSVIAGASRALERADAVILEHSPDWSRGGGLPVEDSLRALAATGFVPHVLLEGGGLARTNFEALLGFEGSLDVVCLRISRLGAAASQVKETADNVVLLQAIAERNKHLK
jgi:FkbM family methyltransferase